MKAEIFIESDTSTWMESLAIIFVLGINLCAILTWLMFTLMCLYMGRISQGFLSLSMGIFFGWVLKRLCLTDGNS